MYTTNFRVQKRKISQIDSVPYTGEYNIDTFKFEFDDEWEGLDKTLVFISGDNRYNIALLNNEALMPFEMYQIKGNIQIGLFGTDNGLRTLATGWLPLYIEEDSYEVNVEPENLPTPTQWDLYVTEINRLLELCQASQEQCELIQAQIEEDYEAYLADLNQIKSDTLGYKNDTQVLKNQTNQIKNDVIGLKNQIESDIADAELRIDEYNANAQAKTNQFNQNATAKTNSYNDNADSKISAYNSNATNKTNAFNDNASSKTTTFNSNATNKTTAFNNNATSKTDDYNSNATSKTTAFNENYTEKYNAVTLAGTTAVGNVQTAENTAITNIETAGSSYDARINDLLDQIPVGTVEDTYINVQDSSDLPIKDIQVEGNSTQVTTSIAGGDEYDSPSPDHQQPIKVVTGDVSVNVIRKNIYNSSYRTYAVASGLTASNIETNSVNLLGKTAWGNWGIQFKNPKKNENCTISAKFLETVLNHSSRITVYGSDISPFTTASLSSNIGDTTSISLTKGTVTNLSCSFNSGNYEYIVIRFWNNPTGTALLETSNLLISDIQLEFGSSETEFEPYTSQSQLLSLGSIELAKIGDYQDYIYKDKTSGKWYKHNVIEKKVLDGSETWTVELSGETRYFYRTPAGGRVKGLTLSNYYPYAGGLITGNNDYIGIARSNVTSASSQIRVRYGTEQTLSDFKTWLSTHNVVVYSAVEKATDTEITDTTLLSQLNDLYNMHTYKNITNIFTTTENEEPILNVTYRKDLQTLTDKIALLDARLSLLE